MSNISKSPPPLSAGDPACWVLISTCSLRRSRIWAIRLRVKTWFVVLRDFQIWLERHGHLLSALEESLLEQFLEDRKGRRQREGKNRYGAVGARTVYHLLDHLLDHLRRQGVAAAPRATADQSPLALLQTRYEKYLRHVRGLSPVTPSRYWPTLERFLFERFGDDDIRLRELVADDVSAFLLRHAQSGTPAVAKLRVTALRSFFRFLFQNGETQTDLAGAVPSIRTWRFSGVPKFLKPEDVERVIDSCNQDLPIGRRDRALLLLIARLGLRASEVIALELEDIDWRAGVIIIRGKGRFHDRLPLPEDVGKALATYLRRDRPASSTRRVFVRIRAPHRGFANPTTISTIVCRALNRAGLEPPLKGAHILRHSLATGMLRGGASMAEIGQILRHRSPNTTEIYAKVDIDGLRSIARPWPTKGGAR